MNHQTQTLSERPNGYVGFCDCCQRFNVSFNNSLLSGAFIGQLKDCRNSNGD